MHKLGPAARSPDSQSSSRGRAEPPEGAGGGAEGPDCSHLAPRTGDRGRGGTCPPGSTEQRGFGEPLSKAGWSTPFSGPWPGSEGAPGSLPLLGHLPQPPCFSSDLLLDPGGRPLPNSLLPFRIPRSPAGPRPRASSPTKALKGEKADSLRCPLKPPLHFHQPRCRWLAGSTPEVTSCFPPRTRVPPATRPRPPAATGGSCLKNKFSGSQPSAGSGTGGAGRTESGGQAENIQQAEDSAGSYEAPEIPERAPCNVPQHHLSRHLAADSEALSEQQNRTCWGREGKMGRGSWNFLLLASFSGSMALKL